MTQRYAGMLRRVAIRLDKQEMPVQAECLRQAARHMEGLQAAKDAIACPWQPMKTAPKDGSVVLVLLEGTDYGHPAYWLSGKDSPRVIGDDTAPGWRMAWDASPIADHDGPRYWMESPYDPESDMEGGE
jgi:hypothetical protein